MNGNISINQLSFSSDDKNPHDVLSGKGNGAKNHEGNRHFRALVESAKELYISCPESRKIQISKLVYEAIKSLSPQGRYLKKDEKGELYELSYKEALTKTSQALREGQPKHKKSGCFKSIQDEVTFYAKLNEVKVSLSLFIFLINPFLRTDIGYVI